MIVRQMIDIQVAYNIQQDTKEIGHYLKVQKIRH